MDDIVLYEVNEVFGLVLLVWSNVLGVDLSKFNVNGGVQVLGYFLGVIGVKLMVILIYELCCCKQWFGLLVICEGLGMVNVIIIENMDF